MVEVDGAPTSRGVARWAPALVLLGLWLFHAANNWLWLAKNVTNRGWDRMNALVNSLLYNATLSHFSLQALFKASTQDEIRPPLFATSMALMYKLFGVSRDVAVMVNVVYLAILLAASYGIGKKLGGRRLGMLSAALAAFLPLVFSMSRYSYFEFALTALVAAAVYLLLASDHFQNRRNTLLLGVVLGLGTLLKRTFPVFVFGPLFVVVLQAGLIARFWAALRARPRIHWRAVAIALAGGLALSALWVFPNRDLVQTLPAGPWLFPAWWVLASVTIYFVLRPPTVPVNALASGTLAVSIASLWYLPHSNFVQRALRAGWGVDDPRGRTASLLNPGPYIAYLQSIVLGISLAYVILLLLVVALLAGYLLWRRPRLRPGSWLRSNWVVIAAAVLVPYLILSTSIYHEHRAITPFLPFLGLLLAALLLRLPWRPLRTGLIAFALLFGLVQFLAVSYTETHGIVVKTRLPSRILGQAYLFDQGPYVELPDSGANDPGFWIVDDVLPRVEATRVAEGWDTISLGVMAESAYVHASMFVYDQLQRYPAVVLDSPVQTYPMDSPYSMAFRYDYLVVLEQRNRGATIKEGVKLILDERRPFFDQAFELEAVYPLPDKDTAYLFRRRYTPSATVDASALYDAAQYLGQQTTAADLLAVASPGLLDGLLESYWGPAPIVTLSGPATLSQALVSQAPAGKEEPNSRLFVLSGADTGTGGLDGDPLGGLLPTQVLQFGPLQVAVLDRASP